MLERILPADRTLPERAALVLTGVYIFVLNFPWVISVREASFFLALALILYPALKRREWPPLGNFLVLWLGAALLSLLATDDLWYSLSEVKKEVLYAILAFYLAYAVTRSTRDFLILSAFAVAGAAAVSGASFYAYYIGGYTFEDLYHTGLLYENRAYYTFHMTSAAVLCMSVAMYGEGRTSRIIPAALGPVLLFSAYFARLRSGYLAIAISALMLLFYTSLPGKSLKRKAFVVALALMMLIPLPAVIGRNDLNVTLSPGSMAGSIKKLRAEERWLIWEGAIGRIKEKPLLGHGFGRKEFFASGILPPRNIYPHNILLSYGVMAGVVGIFALAVLFARLFMLHHSNVLKSFREGGPHFGISLSGVLIFSLFLTLNMTADVMTRHAGQYFWALTGMVLGAASPRVSKTPVKEVEGYA